jgi:hypothetical protein
VNSNAGKAAEEHVSVIEKRLRSHSAQLQALELYKQKDYNEMRIVMYVSYSQFGL